MCVVWGLQCAWRGHFTSSIYIISLGSYQETKHIDISLTNAPELGLGAFRKA